MIPPTLHLVLSEREQRDVVVGKQQGRDVTQLAIPEAVWDMFLVLAPMLGSEHAPEIFLKGYEWGGVAASMSYLDQFVLRGRQWHDPDSPVPTLGVGSGPAWTPPYA